jgi:hypothetical protein
MYLYICAGGSKTEVPRPDHAVEGEALQAGVVVQKYIHFICPKSALSARFFTVTECG